MAVILVGQPNSGKSLVFNKLTGIETMVSNYSGTSLEATRGRINVKGNQMELVDTPGIYSLALAEGPAGETRQAIMNLQDNDLIINVVDANKLSRNLALTLELIELNLPTIVLLNQIEVARDSQLVIDQEKLSQYLGRPVIAFSAQTGEGIPELMRLLAKGIDKSLSTPPKMVLVSDIPACSCDGDCFGCLDRQKATCSEQMVFQRYQQARKLAEQVLVRTDKQPQGLEVLEQFLDNTRWGVPVLICLALIGFSALLTFVGWGEGLVTQLFLPVQEIISRVITRVVPPGFWNSILSRGVPEGLLIPFSLVMPAMLMVSFLLSLIEDTGLLPRYAVMLDRLGRFLGVSGQAVIPLSLGFGCRTPAVTATRILPSVGQRFIIITLLSIVIPCAGTIGMLASTIVALDAHAPVIILTMVAVFFILGWVLKKLYGEEEEPVYELPPLRLPQVQNIITKIKLRFQGFFTEVLPLLLVMSVGVRIIIDSGVLNRLHYLEPVTTVLFGIPPEAVVGVLVTIIQRYLAPLILLNLSLDPREATIAISMIALSVPCLPVMVMTVREMGVKALLKIVSLGFSVSFLIGILLNLVLP
ncbi:MAG: FeoB small GTPase domain-containing protein [Bacillota bacterium]